MEAAAAARCKPPVHIFDPNKGERRYDATGARVRRGGTGTGKLSIGPLSFECVSPGRFFNDMTFLASGRYRYRYGLGAQR